MAATVEIDQLNRKLHKNSLGPVGVIVDQSGALTWHAAGSMVDLLRQAAFDRPLITFLLAAQVGYVVARMGRPHASV